MSFESRKDGRVASIGASLEVVWVAAELGRLLYARAMKHLAEAERRQIVYEMLGLAIAIFALLAINTAYAVFWSFLIRRFATALQEKKEEIFYSVLYEVAINLILKVPLSSLTEYLKGQLSLKLRSICTKGLFFAFFNSKHRPFFHTNIENAGIRILEVESWIRDAQHLAIVIISRIMNLFAFSSLMLYLSSRLFVALTLYAFLGTFILLHYFYEKITTLSMSTTQKMTSVQYQVVRIYENREAIAFYNGAARECRILWNFFDAFMKSAYERMVWIIGMHSFTEVLEDATVVFPYLVIAPLYFGGEIEYGVVSQSAMAFHRVRSALNIIVDNFSVVSSIRATTLRLKNLLEDLEGP